MNSRAIRTMVVLREATPADVDFLSGIWSDLLRRGEAAEHVHDLETVVKTAAASAEQRLVIADHDGRPVGAVFLQLTTVSPINLTPTVLVTAPFVVHGFRRKGVGHALMEAAVTWAEENGVATLCSAATAGSRDANRYFARLGLSGSATYRIGATQAVRDRLTEQLPASQRVHGYRPQRVLAARRVRRANSVN